MSEAERDDKGRDRGSRDDEVGATQRGGDAKGLVARIADVWLRVLSLLVTASHRADWLEEWRAELDARARDGAGSTGARVAADSSGGRRGDLLTSAWGALPDAWYFAGRGGWGLGWSRELRVVVRGLLRRPGFTAVAVSTLALGIGANAALFSVAKTVLLRPLPFEEPDRLVRLWGTLDGERVIGGTVSYPDVHDIGRRTGALAGWAAFDEWYPAVGPEGAAPEVIFGGTVNTSFFDVLGVEPELGRFWTPDEEGEGRELLVVIGHGLWQRRFGGDPRALNRSILVNGNPVTVIGVLPRDFETPGLEGGSFGAPEIWRTVATPPPFRSGRSWSAVARLEDGVSLADAQLRVDDATRVLEQEFPDDNLGWGIRLVPLREQLIGDAGRVIALLMSTVALVLLIACANVASLLLVRAIEKRRELDLRVALGASRLRLVGTTLLESGLLAVSGGALGVALAYVGVRASGRVLGQFLPRTEALGVDPTVTAFAVGVAVLTGLLFGVVPAADAWLRSAGGSRVASGARGGSAGVEGVRLRRALVASEVAVSVVLLVGAGVLMRTLDALYDVDLGIQREGVLAAGLHSSAFTSLEPEEADALYGRLLEGLRALPGVTAAGAINIVPLSGGFSCDGVTRDDLPPASPGNDQCAEIRTILPGALEGLGVTALEGRLTTEADHRPGAQRVVLVSREMAAAFWPGETPIGKSVTVHEVSWQVVGVVSDVRHFGPAGRTRPQAYMPAQHDPWGGVSYGLNLVIRGSGDADALAPAVRRVVEQTGAKLAITSLRSVDDLLATSVAAPRFRGALLGAFATLAVVLAMVGLGGVVAYSVRQRKREIGVRIALGATPRSISSMVLGEAARLIVAGAAVGVLGAVLVAGALDSMVFGVSVRDPWTIAAAPLLIALVGFAVSWLPARRAARSDPLRGLTAD